MRPPPPPALVSPDAACLQDLTAAHATFQALGTFGEGHCSIANPVRMSGGAVPWSRPGIVTCPMARTMTRFEAEVVQPLAQKYFGQKAVRINHFGTYDCRAQRNEASEAAAKLGTSKGGRRQRRLSARFGPSLVQEIQRRADPQSRPPASGSHPFGYRTPYPVRILNPAVRRAG